MSHQICPPCRDAADIAASHRARGVNVPAAHDPDICRDHAIQPHGCGCAHGLTHQPAPTPRTREAQPA